MTYSKNTERPRKRYGDSPVQSKILLFKKLYFFTEEAEWWILEFGTDRVKLLKLNTV